MLPHHSHNITHNKQTKKFHIRATSPHTTIETTRILMKSISNCILQNTKTNSTTDIILDSDYMGIHFYADTVSTYTNTDPITYNTAVHMLFYLGQQQQYLETLGYGVYQLSRPDNNTMKDVIVINNRIYLYANQSHIKKLNKSKQFQFDYPFDKTQTICSPELMKIYELPAAISYNTFYYSLATVICQLLAHHPTTVETAVTQDPLQPIINTKLYWCIKRCLDERILLFI